MTSVPVTPLPHRVVLYFPATQRNGAPIVNHENIAQGVELLLCAQWGGVTRYPAVGNFKTSDGAIHREAVEVFELYCESDDWEQGRRALKVLASELAALLDQESIALACDGRLFLVPGSSEAGQPVPAVLCGGTAAEMADALRVRVKAVLESEPRIL